MAQLAEHLLNRHKAELKQEEEGRRGNKEKEGGRGGGREILVQ
jgi:hypothetical protein